MTSSPRCLLVAVLLALVSTPLLAAVTREQQQELTLVGTILTRAGNLYKQDKFNEAGELIKQAQAKIEKLAESGDEQVLKQLEGSYTRLLKAHALLEIEGVKLSEIKPLPKKTDKPAQAAPGSPAAAAAVTFTKDVAPIIVARCGGCHVRRTQGGLSMATYEALMTGNKNGKVIIAGKPEGSVLCDKIEGKEMPPNGAGIPDAEFTTIKKWIADGAKFDGADAKANLTTFTGGNRPMMEQVQVKVATGKETISFSRDIAPVLAQNCLGCHGAMRPGANFNMTIFEGLLRGGDSGAPIQPGKGADSYLVKKLKGTASQGQRMPLRNPPLADDVIAKFEKWIDEGATFDGGDTKLAIDIVAAIAKANASTHEELSAERVKMAGENWRLGMPGIEADKVETPNFLVLGSVGPNTLKQIGDEAEALAPKVGEMLKAPTDKPLFKGRITLFVFKERYDYGEFGQMVEKRAIPPVWRGHHRFTIVDAYAVVIPPKAGEDYSLQTLIAQQVAGCYVASLGKGTPAWFSEGAGRVVASRLDGGDPRVAAWDDAIPGIVSSMGSADAFLTGKILNPEEVEICAYSFVKFLMTDSRRFTSLLDQLRKGGEFTQSFSAVYGGSPSQVAEAWARKPPGRSVPAKKPGKK